MAAITSAANVELVVVQGGPMGSPYRQRHEDGTYTEQTTTKATKTTAKTTSSTPKTTTPAKTTTRPDTQT